MCRVTAIIFKYAGQMQQVPCHERRVAVREIVFRTARTWVKVAWTRAYVSQPACICLRRDGVADVLQAVENIHRTVLYAVFVPRYQTPPALP